MKKLLLLLSIFVTFLGYSQTIQNFDSDEGSEFFVVTSDPADMDQSTSGASGASAISAIWDFEMLSNSSVSTEDTYTTRIPDTPVDMFVYPNTTSIQTTTPSSGNPIKLYTREDNISNILSITGIDRDGLTLNYDGTDMNNSTPNLAGNAEVGLFPMLFTNPSSTDNVSGKFSFFSADFGTITGFFTGTATTNVDAYGTLNTNDLGNGTYSGQVTRLKIEQDLAFNQLNAIASQLSYYYYETGTGNLILRYTEILISQSSGSLFDPIQEVLIEHIDTSTLSVDDNRLNVNVFNMYPNPVKNTLNFSLVNDTKIQSFIVSDVTGRQVLEAKNNNNSFDASQLNPGVYIMTVNTNKGLVSRKFVKE